MSGSTEFLLFFLPSTVISGDPMSGSTEFLLYVTVYRLTVLAIGALSIYLGFRLFSRPPGVVDSVESSSSVGVQAGKFKLRVTNFLPGIYFALFGTVLIGIMLWR